MIDDVGHDVVGRVDGAMILTWHHGSLIASLLDDIKELSQFFDVLRGDVSLKLQSLHSISWFDVLVNTYLRTLQRESRFESRNYRGQTDRAYGVATYRRQIQREPSEILHCRSIVNHRVLRRSGDHHRVQRGAERFLRHPPWRTTVDNRMAESAPMPMCTLSTCGEACG